jgi:ankyrin repeat protein
MRNFRSGNIWTCREILNEHPDVCNRSTLTPVMFRENDGSNELHHLISRKMGELVIELFTPEQIRDMLQKRNNDGELPLHTWIARCNNVSLYYREKKEQTCIELLKLFGHLMQEAVYDVPKSSAAVLAQAQQDRDSTTPLICAWKLKRLRILTYFVKHMGCPIEHLMKCTSDLIFSAVSGGACWLIEKLVQRDIPIDDPNREESLLIWAVQLGNPDTVNILIRLGHELDRRDKHGYTALMYAVRYNRIEIFESLIAAGAVCNDNGSPIPMMHLAAQRVSSAQLFNRCLQVGFPINIFDGYTPMHRAIATSNYITIKQLAIHASWTLNTPDLVATSQSLVTRTCKCPKTYKLLQALGVEVSGLPMPMTEDEIAEIRFSVYFVQDLVSRLLQFV